MRFQRLLVAVAMTMLSLTDAHAQGRVARVIVPYAAGGTNDAIARVYTKHLREAINESWIVENISGGNGVIGTERVARAAPDGATLLFGADGHSMTPLVIKNVPYDPIRDFQPIALAARAPLVFVVNASAVHARNLKELVEEIKRDANRHTFAVGALGSSTHLGAEIFKTRTGLIVLSVAYRGTGPALTDLAGGHVTLMTVAPLAAMPLVHAGKLRALAITAPQRFEGTPDVPTAEEAGMPGFEVINSYGFWGPKGLRNDQIARLSDAIRKAAHDPELRKRLLDLGVAAHWESPQAFEMHIQTEFTRYRAILEKAGIKPE
jgi:tripartite-type tricarboxylate transporter receptor subunit TctC